jgi:hypothetical protein
MSGCNCIGAEAWLLAYRALADAQERVQCSPQMCCTPGVLCTPDHEFRTFKQSVLSEERLTSYMQIISVASGEQQHRQMSGWLYWAEAWWRTAEAGLADALRAVQCSHWMCCTPGVLNCRSRGSELSSRVSCIERLTSYADHPV